MTAVPLPRTLDAVSVGEEVALTVFPFPTLLSLCRDLGLGPGSIVRCLVAAPRVVLVERADGTRIRLDSEWAKLIQVESLAAANGSVK